MYALLSYVVKEISGVFSPVRLRKSIKASIVIESELDAVITVLDDYECHSQWVPLLVESKRLENVGVLQRMVYNRYRLPLPLSDRDFVFHVKGLPDHKNKVFTCIMSSDAYSRAPERNGVVRGKLHQSVFKLYEVDATRTCVELTCDVDPGGLIPYWLNNVISKSWSHFVLAGLKSEVMSRSGL